ncbi:MAG: glycosyltransferase [Rhizobacter sp.]|nr:glycosyltransferase [Ferruginibacter sp.]
MATTKISDIFVQLNNILLPKVSIIIPCYNQGHYLQDALSGFVPENDEYEIIIINDGSTHSIDELNHFRSKGFTIIDQANAGLASARNTGISHSRGQFIMLLDADNRVEPVFIQAASKILESNTHIAVVYSDAEYFGSKSGRWKVGEFNLQKLMIENYIDACAMVRKSVFKELGGYDTEMKNIRSGWEDWEMWLRISFAGKAFSYWPRVGFHYRVNESSMISDINNSYEVRNNLTTYLHNKYPAKLGHQFITEFVVRRFKPHPFKFIIKLGMISWFNKKYLQLLNKNKIMKGI